MNRGKMNIVFIMGKVVTNVEYNFIYDRYKIKIGELDNKQAKQYLCGHFGYIKYASIKNLTGKLFEI